MSVTLEVKMEKKLKEAAESIYNEIGISLDEAVRLFVMKSVEEGKMPFKTDTKKRALWVYFQNTPMPIKFQWKRELTKGR